MVQVIVSKTVADIWQGIAPVRVPVEGQACKRGYDANDGCGLHQTAIAIELDAQSGVADSCVEAQEGQEINRRLRLRG
jgi:hypothetical protein